MPPLRVLVVGASIAGPATAYWLARAGHRVTVIERFSQLRTSGQNVDIRTAGVTVMRRLPGLEEAVRTKLSPLDGISFVDTTGHAFATMKSSGDSSQQNLVSEYEIFRGDLARILYDKTVSDPNINYIFNEQIESISRPATDGPVTVTFQNGLPTSEYDLIAACDGATSRTRAIGFNCSVRDHIRRLNCWAAYFTIKSDLLSGSNTGQSYSAIGGRFFGVGPDPDSKGCKVTLMGLKPIDEKVDATLAFREAAKQGDESLKKYIADYYRGVGWKTDDILDGLMESEDFYASELVQVNMPKLYNGRVVLVGDAGYASGFTGTGTSMALTGAYILAGEISRAGEDVAAGLRGYEDRIRPIIKDLQQIPPGMPGMLAPQTAGRLRLRNLLFRVVAFLSSLGNKFAWISGLFASGFGKDKYGIPEYEGLHVKVAGQRR